MEFRGLMGGFYRISEWIMRLSVINVLWALCSLPVFIVGLMGLMSLQIDETFSQFYFFLLILGVLSPFTLFPATAAMFSVARKWLTGEEDVPLFKTFFRGYKENYKQAMLGGLIYLVFGIIIGVNLYFYNTRPGNLSLLKYLILMLTVLLTVSLFHFFSILSHLHMKLLQIIKNAVLISIGHPVRSISMLVLNGVVIYFSFAKFTFLIPFFMGTIVAVISFWHFNHIFGRLQEKQQELAEKESEAQAASDEQTALESGTDQAEADHAEKKEPSSAAAMNQQDDGGHTKPDKP
ncbi:YesL family protein [Paenibacillus vulneris]|uniref:YesL family protein n=1 Tax=Paenibacillus vulneris TaxID=1133364 RepID=A0ABW3UES9_9BACL